MVDQLIIEKPYDVVIDPVSLRRAVNKYDDGYSLISLERNGKLWRMSGKNIKFNNSSKTLFSDYDMGVINSPDYRFVLVLNNSFSQKGKEAWIWDEKSKSEKIDDYMIFTAAGNFPWITGTDELNIIWEKFLKPLDNQARFAMLKNIFNFFKRESFCTISRSGVVRFGNWVEINGAYFSSGDFAESLKYPQKNYLAAILSYIFQEKNQDKAPHVLFNDLRKLTDAEIEKEARKLPNGNRLIETALEID